MVFKLSPHHHPTLLPHTKDINCSNPFWFYRRNMNSGGQKPNRTNQAKKPNQLSDYNINFVITSMEYLRGIIWFLILEQTRIWPWTKLHRLMSSEGLAFLPWHLGKLRELAQMFSVRGRLSDTGFFFWLLPTKRGLTGGSLKYQILNGILV